LLLEDFSFTVALFRLKWPPEAVPSILSDFDDPNHEEEDPSAESVGDRRQEVVFIGPGLLSKDRQSAITECLDQCLLLDEPEWQVYKERRSDERSLKTAFANSLPERMLSY
jgi:hypothetical protein